MVQRVPEPEPLELTLDKLLMSSCLSFLMCQSRCEPIYATCLAQCLTHLRAMHGFAVRILSPVVPAVFFFWLILCPASVVRSAVRPPLLGGPVQTAQHMVSPAGLLRAVCSHTGWVRCCPEDAPYVLAAETTDTFDGQSLRGGRVALYSLTKTFASHSVELDPKWCCLVLLLSY